MCGANKHTANKELVLLPDEWISLFGHGTFQRYVFIQLNSFELQEMVSIVSQNMEPLSFCSTSRGGLNAQVMMNMLAIR